MVWAHRRRERERLDRGEYPDAAAGAGQLGAGRAPGAVAGAAQAVSWEVAGSRLRLYLRETGPLSLYNVSAGTPHIRTTPPRCWRELAGA
eukprot:3947520-Prymnesium_polylepis.1